jgi:hypothetical protein
MLTAVWIAADDLPVEVWPAGTHSSPGSIPQVTWFIQVHGNGASLGPVRPGCYPSPPSLQVYLLSAGPGNPNFRYQENEFTHIFFDPFGRCQLLFATNVQRIRRRFMQHLKRCCSRATAS